MGKPFHPEGTDTRKKWLYLEGGMFLVLIVTLIAHISFPTRHLSAAEASFLVFIPAFSTLLLTLMLRGTKKNFALALTVSITAFAIYGILQLLGAIVPLGITAITAVSLGIVGAAFLVSEETKLHFFGVLSSFAWQALAIALFIIH